VKRSAALLPLLALLLVGSGCGAKDALELDPVAEAASKTAETGSSRVEFTMDMKVAGESFDVTGSGAFVYSDSLGFLTFRMALPELGNVTMDMRMVGTKLYMRMPDALGGESLPSGKEWIGFDLAKSLEQVGLGSFDFTRQQDPAQMLRYLRAASADVSEAGYDKVRGVQTTRYVGRMDLRKALDAGLEELRMSDAEREQARQGMQGMLDQVGAATVPFEVFIDAQGLLRRLSMDMSMTIEGEQLGMEMQMDYYDFGVTVEVQAPPASSVLDVTDALQP
jgi:hypothetical protein